MPDTSHSSQYDHITIEQKWQKKWEEENIYRTVDPKDLKGQKHLKSNKKFYGLIEFPYPSGEGLHVGHPRSYTAMDIICRKKRMEGYHVLFPIGFDAFGLPSENYAIKTGIHPKLTTKKNIETFTRQLKSLGFSFDWERAVDTTDPKYYKWTQWIFLQLFKKGLAYKANIPINWCLSCKIGLANEEVVDGKCERCEGNVEKRNKSQWMLKITEYADRLDKDLDTVDFWEKIKTQQRNWIGKSEGINIDYNVEGIDKKITVFTTRPDTNFGATFIAIAPDSTFTEENINLFPEKEKVKEYVQQAKRKSDLERIAEGRLKTGVFTGLYAINNLNNKKMPIYIADFVLGSVGTGIVVGVPGHDIRDFEFAQAMKLEVIRVVVGKDGDTSSITRPEQVQEEEGTMINSGFLDGMDIHEATKKIMDYLEQKGWGKRKVHYKLRDWVFSRQRYWGEPIPLVYCEHCKKIVESEESNKELGIRNKEKITKLKIKNLEFSVGELLNPGWIAVEENQLPVQLPNVEKYEPTDTGESPLAVIDSWVKTTCPKCGKEAKRETDTMPNWAGSSWYFLRYIDPNNEKALADPEKLKYWMPVDWYNGGMEHTTLHLLYSRFWNKFLCDIGAVPVSEPYQKRTSHGMILGEGGAKMSKSRGNVINPDEIINKYGADTLRLYEMFMGPFDQAIPWDCKGVEGCYRFIGKIWKIYEKITENTQDNPSVTRLLHKTIRKVTDDIERMGFNTAVSSCMIFINEVQKQETINKELFTTFLKIVSPFIPHIVEELWKKLGNKESIHLEKWPQYDPSLAKDEEVEIPIQINGKVRSKIIASPDISEEEALSKAHNDENLKKWIEGKTIVKEIFVKGRIINIVVKDI